MYPAAYIQYLAHFHGDRDYFECHEILEEYWKETDPGNKNSVWVAFIQLAVSAYHHRRGNFNGALKTIRKSRDLFTVNKEAVENLGIDHQLLDELLSGSEIRIKKKHPYQSANLPITDPELAKLCAEECIKLGIVWGSPSNLNRQEITHRHSLRDRSDVIAAREEAKQNRSIRKEQ